MAIKNEVALRNCIRELQAKGFVYAGEIFQQVRKLGYRVSENDVMYLMGIRTD